MILDSWQQEVLDYSGDLLLSTGRRVGKTYILARKAIDWMAKNKNMPVVIVSLTEDQAMIIMSMALNYAKETYLKLLGKGKYKPTLRSLYLNGGRMIVRPVGNTGDGARGFEGGILIVDEAARMPKMFWIAAKPILLTTNGQIWMSSTPFGKEGYFWERYDEVVYKKDPQARFKVFAISTEEVVKNRVVCPSWTEVQKNGALRVLEEDKREMTNIEYAQEYLGMFVDELLSFFPEDLIEKCCTLKRKGLYTGGKNYLGVDVGGLGTDKSSFEVIAKISRERLEHAENLTTKRTYVTDTTKKIMELENIWHFRRLGIDNGGLGVGVFHPLLVSSIKNKVIGLNNATKALDKDGKRKTSLLKEDMYILTKSLMEQGKLKLLADEDVIVSLRSIQQELVVLPNKPSTIRITGRDSHITEGIVRAVWIAVEDKTLDVWCR